MKTNSKILIAVALFATLASCEKEKCPPEVVPTEKTVTIQPGTTNGNDAFVAYNAGVSSTANSNFADLKEMDAYAWTNGGALVLGRTFISFPFDSIPAGAEIISAKLSVYGTASSIIAPQGNSGTNAMYIQRVLGSWAEGTVTWNNQPTTTTESQMETSATAVQWNYNIADVDVTAMVKQMRIYPTATNGFSLRLKSESPFGSIVFSTSEADDATKRPKLVVVYKK
jgi:hypothetical protein